MTAARLAYHVLRLTVIATLLAFGVLGVLRACRSEQVEFSEIGGGK